MGFEDVSKKALRRVEAAGEDPQAGLEALIRSLRIQTLDDQMPFRRAAMASLDHWFQEAQAGKGDRVPTCQGRRNSQIRNVIAPLESELRKRDADRIARALGVTFGAEAMISLTDAVGLDVAAAKASLLDANRWLLAGALAELTSEEK
jgi:hypothetical protein